MLQSDIGTGGAVFLFVRQFVRHTPVPREDKCSWNHAVYTIELPGTLVFLTPTYSVHPDLEEPPFPGFKRHRDGQNGEREKHIFDK